MDSEWRQFSVEGPEATKTRTKTKVHENILNRLLEPLEVSEHFGNAGDVILSDLAAVHVCVSLEDGGRY
jgi:hypothetical protein